MAKQLLFQTLWRLGKRHQSGRSLASGGFTLLELLIVTIIAGGIVSGLMYMVIELLGADQREASRTDTQREMRLAMDYIVNEVQESVYVYEGECIQGDGSPAGDRCHGILNYLPGSLQSNRSVPVLAFWKQQPLPQTVRQACSAGNAAANVPCISAHSYALIVYSLSTEDPSNIWDGKARITRYALTQFQQDGTPNTGYADPGQFNNFDTWPYAVDPDTQVTFNAQNGTPAGSAQVLTDYVDDGTGAALLTPAIPTGNSNLCPNRNLTNLDYEVSPSPTALASTEFNGRPRSFFACISTGDGIGENREVILFLRGNAYGRPGIASEKGFLPTLETRVLSRGVLQRSPN